MQVWSASKVWPVAVGAWGSKMDACESEDDGWRNGSVLSGIDGPSGVVGSDGDEVDVAELLEDLFVKLRIYLAKQSQRSQCIIVLGLVWVECLTVSDDAMLSWRCALDDLDGDEGHVARDGDEVCVYLVANFVGKVVEGRHGVARWSWCRRET